MDVTSWLEFLLKTDTKCQLETLPHLPTSQDQIGGRSNNRIQQQIKKEILILLESRKIPCEMTLCILGGVTTNGMIWLGEFSLQSKSIYQEGSATKDVNLSMTDWGVNNTHSGMAFFLRIRTLSRARAVRQSPFFLRGSRFKNRQRSSSSMLASKKKPFVVRVVCIHPLLEWARSRTTRTLPRLKQTSPSTSTRSPAAVFKTVTALPRKKQVWLGVEFTTCREGRRCSRALGTYRNSNASIFSDHIAILCVVYRHWRMSCTRRRVKTTHFVVRTERVAQTLAHT